MSWDYGFGELENQLIEAGKEYPPNYEKMRELLAAGANINATSTEEDPDEVIYAGFSKETAKSFIENFEKYLNDNKDSIRSKS